MANKALVNYYAKLLQRGSVTSNEIPPEIFNDVQKKMETLPPLEHDPVTETPAAGQEPKEEIVE